MKTATLRRRAVEINLPSLSPIMLALSQVMAGDDREKRAYRFVGGFDSRHARMRLHIANHRVQAATGGKKFEIPLDKHAAIWGKSGVGKSSLLKTISVAAMRAGLGLTIADPHGDLIDEILELVPVERTNDVILFDPKNDRPIGLGLLEGKDQSLSLDALITFIKTRWPDGWGPRTDQLITNVTLAILDIYSKPTIIHVHRFFSRKENRKLVFERAKDPVVRDFIEMFEGWEKRLREEATAAPANKISKFLTNPLLRDIYGQTKTLNFREVLDKKRILLCKLPKGSLGSDVSSMLGSTILFKLFQASLEREHLPFEKRVPHLVVLDEVSSFADDATLSRIFAEARKYRLTLFIAGQMPSQLDEPAEVFGNVTTNIVFRLGGRDAKLLEEEFGLEVPSKALVQLPNRWAYATTVIGDVVVGPVRAEMLPPIQKNGGENRKRDVIAWSLNNYGTDRAQVEREVADLLAEGGWKSKPKHTNKQSRVSKPLKASEQPRLPS